MRKSLKLKKWFARLAGVAMTGLMVVGMMTGCAGGVKKITDGNYPATPDYVKVLGRYYVQETENEANDTVLWLSLSATGVEFECENCSYVEFELKGDSLAADKTNTKHQPRYGVMVNGEMRVDNLLGATGTERIELKDDEKNAVVRFVKLSESSDSTLGIQSIKTDGSLKATADKSLKIEFVGDSITCGYGADGQLGDTYSTANENATKTYAYLTAQKLDADYSMVSYSGYGIYSGYTTSTTEPNTTSLLPPYYGVIGNSYGVIPGVGKANELAWDFTKFVPDYVVINLGTNDASYCKNGDTKSQYVTKYVEFLKQVREKNPKATIICALGIMGQDMLLSMQEAVGKYSSETGDKNVEVLELAVQDAANDGVVVDYHPSLATSEKASDTVVEFIKSLEAE